MSELSFETLMKLQLCHFKRLRVSVSQVSPTDQRYQASLVVSASQCRVRHAETAFDAIHQVLQLTDEDLRTFGSEVPDLEELAEKALRDAQREALI